MVLANAQQTKALLSNLALHKEAKPKMKKKNRIQRLGKTAVPATRNNAVHRGLLEN
jgi:hypothetical protein